VDQLEKMSVRCIVQKRKEMRVEFI
jgi:hypothetical protein